MFQDFDPPSFCLQGCCGLMRSKLGPSFLHPACAHSHSLFCVCICVCARKDVCALCCCVHVSTQRVKLIQNSHKYACGQTARMGACACVHVHRSSTSPAALRHTFSAEVLPCQVETNRVRVHLCVGTKIFEAQMTQPTCFLYPRKTVMSMSNPEITPPPKKKKAFTHTHVLTSVCLIVGKIFKSFIFLVNSLDLQSNPASFVRKVSISRRFGTD